MEILEIYTILIFFDFFFEKIVIPEQFNVDFLNPTLELSFLAEDEYVV